VNPTRPTLPKSNDLGRVFVFDKGIDFLLISGHAGKRRVVEELSSNGAG